eukprot:1136634-Pelagomonas_calceolata.AAC.3
MARYGVLLFECRFKPESLTLCVFPADHVHPVYFTMLLKPGMLGSCSACCYLRRAHPVQQQSWYANMDTGH